MWQFPFLRTLPLSRKIREEPNFYRLLLLASVPGGLLGRGWLASLYFVDPLFPSDHTAFGAHRMVGGGAKRLDMVSGGPTVTGVVVNVGS